MEKTQQEIVQVVEGKVKNAAAQVAELKVKDDAGLETAATLLTNIKKLGKFIIGEKEKILKPMREATNAARAIFSPLEDQIESAEKKIKTEMVAYQSKKEAEQRKKEESIAKRVESGQLKEETGLRKMEALGEVKNNLQTETRSTAFTKKKAVRVIDKDKVPDEYWIIDMVTLRSAALNAAKIKGQIGEVIPGVEVYEEMGVAASV